MKSKETKYYRCKFCDFKSTDISNLQGHIQTHTQERPFFCDQCKGEFSSKHSLKEHKLRVHQGVKKDYDKKYKCSLCSYATYNSKAIEAHTQLHHEDLSFPCPHPDCQYTGKSSHYLRKHFATMHKNKRKFRCEFLNCKFRAKTMVDIRAHSASHSENRPFICDFEGCSYRAKFKDALRVHKVGVHHGGHKPFACSVCNHCCTSKDLLTAHEQTHAEKSLKCNFSGCAFSCKLKSYLNKHVRNFHAEKKFKCDFAGCSSTASSLYFLTQHKKNVHGEKIHKCPSCDYRTAWQSALRQHIGTHKAKRRIPCPTKGCTFQTTHHQYLNAHMRYHKSCPVEGCNHVSHSSSRWKNHLQLHDPTGRPFHCPICPQYFQTNDKLSLHLRRHTQEKPFKCPQCNYAAFKKQMITNHMRAIHPTGPFTFDEESICDHCSIDFGSIVGLALHKIKLKTAVVVLTRLQLTF